MRHTAKLATAFFAALVSLSLSGCNSKDAGETLSIKLQDVGLVLAAESPSTDATTPTVYEGKTTAVALVQYRGEKELGYQWLVSLPGAVGAEVTSTEESIDIDAQVLSLGDTPPDVGNGEGLIRLTVYEKDGTLSKTVSGKLIVIASSGG